MDLIVLFLIGGLITWFGVYVLTRETHTTSPCAANYTLECKPDVDGRFLAEVVPELPGARAWGATAEDAMAKAQSVALRVLAQRLQRGEIKPSAIRMELRVTDGQSIPLQLQNSTSNFRRP
ncbi:hypothetical protein AcdelDRAFT_1874 [Acidovorax delafieldii 2AN]|jgi:predicted RNase H-like HicB family nuclease|uniref:HicB-like antitoxin of toxin-antitoxin system domain-containing protein n=1 Tax=Acidovorax delafieldii 2AN TaxID=573060 RepID=C5T4P4_ACIDE|nr:type II toxin-antitoxin system HicB family antitoxin [Acidovorax delafieldii]EER60537.1 hypothetical protein AcdelDRAFT_1874 [Acidovorax delafieldii 2AN]